MSSAVPASTRPAGSSTRTWRPRVAQSARYCASRPELTGSGSALNRRYQCSSERRISASSASRPTSAPSTSSDVAGRPVGDTGSAFSEVATFSPTPITTASPSADCSARMPASFRSPTRTSFGHLSRAATPDADRTPAATATPVSSGSQPRADGGTEAGRSSTENVSDAPGWLTHVRPARPRPAVCSSATSTWPSRAAAGEQVRVGGAGAGHGPRSTSTIRPSRRGPTGPRRPRGRGSARPQANPPTRSLISRRWRCGGGGSPCPCSPPSPPTSARRRRWTPRASRRRPAGRGRRCRRSAPPRRPRAPGWSRCG